MIKLREGVTLLAAAFVLVSFVSGLFLGDKTVDLRNPVCIQDKTV